MMSADYFAIFDLPHHFNLNAAELEKRYFAVQREFHPDKAVGKSAAERQQAIARSMLANDAYETLKSPIRRARHLLALQGENGSEEKASQALLMEVMEWRETLAELSAMPELEAFAAGIRVEKEATLQGLADTFASGNIIQAKEWTTRLSYLVKLEDEIKTRMKGAAV